MPVSAHYENVQYWTLVLANDPDGLGWRLLWYVLRTVGDPDVRLYQLREGNNDTSVVRRGY